MMGVHNCRQCQMLCCNVHPLCLFCRSTERARVETFVRRAESALATAGTEAPRSMAEGVSPMIVREIDETIARINRREARAACSRRVRLLASRWTGATLLLLGVVGLAWGAFQLCMWFAQGVVAWMGGK